MMRVASFFLLINVVVLNLWKTSIAQNFFLQPPQAQWYNAKNTWKFQKLSSAQVRKVTDLVNVRRLRDEILPNILIVRTPGSQGSQSVRQAIANITSSILGWTVEYDTFTDPTPTVSRWTTFTNVIATHDPSAKRRLALACHYDSKITPTGFLGATDSAVPCSMMLEIAIALRKYLTTLNKQNDLTLELIFFDGEEAFAQWSATDSLYGSRHLSQLWQRTPWPPLAVTSLNRLHSLDLLVVLDLLGAANPKFYNSFYVPSTHFNELARIEKSIYNSNSFFQTTSLFSIVEDDHLPFYVKGVPILHVIPSPFPSQWHTIQDNLSNINMPTVEKLTKIFAVYVAEYLHMQP